MTIRAPRHGAAPPAAGPLRLAPATGPHRAAGRPGGQSGRPARAPAHGIPPSPV
ncbi:hypothetical protein C7S13_1719 [Burkholderia cepacia]|nr:hypothetical protein [Burkholderia cepacia]